MVDCYQKGIRMQAFVVVQLRDQDTFFAALPAAARRRVKFGKLIKSGSVLIPQGAVDASLKDIERAIHTARERYGA